MRTRLAADVAALLAIVAVAVSASQASFEDTLKQLASEDADTRLRAVQLLKDAAYPEAAVPLAKAIADPDDGVQIEAIAAELNIFLAEKIVTRKRVALVVEVRNRIAAEAAFSLGPSALGPRPVPPEVLNALRATMRDETVRVGVEATYALGTLGAQANGSARRDLLAAAAPELASMVAAPDPAFRYGALRVIGRLFAPRPGDAPTDVSLGDAVIIALNDKDATVRIAAMEALGAMRYDRAVQALTDLFAYYGKGNGAEAALDALARIAHPSSTPLMVGQLTSKSPVVKAIAIEGLARSADRGRLADIQKVTSADPGEAVQLAGAFAGAMLGNLPVDQIAEALRKPRTRDQAFGYLVEIATGHFAAFTRYAQDPDASVRADVAEALGMGGDPGALPVVEPLLKDADTRVALAAARAVMRLRAAAARPRS